jgi:prepilin-type N-terminal cleavage/methylation domain-containing protein
MRRGFTLIEIVMTIAITGILAVGTFKALDALFIRSVKAGAVTRLSLTTQTVLDQIGMLLYSRVPASVIGYDPADGSHVPLARIASAKPVLEWLSTAEESRIHRDFSGFIDMNASDKATDTLVSPGSDGSAVSDTFGLKFGTGDHPFASDLIRLVFAGTFDQAQSEGRFGWHGDDASALHPISMSNGGDITLKDSPHFIYEKYYLVDSAYAVARGENVDLDAPCIKNLDTAVDADTLFLFYDYRPWKSESFCGDPSGGGVGRVTLLARNVAGFRAEAVGGTIRVSLDMLRPVRGSTPVHLTKQKVVF